MKTTAFTKAAIFAFLSFFSAHLDAQSWTQLAPSGTTPAARGFQGTTGVYDPGSNRMMVFGGRDTNGNNLNDLWILTNANGLGGTGQWINPIANGASGSPPARSGHSAAYDSANNIMIVFGGCGGSCAPVLSDVWVLSHANGIGGTPAWTQLPGLTGPAGRVNSVVAYNAAMNRLFVYGGQDGSSNPCSTLSDAWILSNANGLTSPPFWGSVEVFGNSGPGNGAASVYDPATDILTAFGGMALVSGTCQATNQLWQEGRVFGGIVDWSNILPEGAVGSPPDRAFHSAIYDSTAARMLVFGGQDSAGTHLNDTWSFLSANGLGDPIWQQLTPSGGPPAARSGNAAVFDSTNQRMTIFGGSGGSGVLSDAWVLTAPGSPEFSCSAISGVPNIVRAEGIAEQVGDVLLNCTGGVPTPSGQPIPQYTLTTTLNTNITSRPVSGSLSEALAIIDDAFPATASPLYLGPAGPGRPLQILCTPLGSTCSETGTGGAPSPYLTQPNVFVGQQTGAGTLQWQIPIDPPGPNTIRTLRITNVRSNASQLPPPTMNVPVGISATVALQAGSQQVPILGQPDVAIVEPGTAITLEGAPSYLQCRPRNASLLGGTGTSAFDFSINVQEGFVYGFKVRNFASLLNGPQFPPQLVEQNVPGFFYATESGFYSPSLFTTAPTLGLADSGTRIIVQFQGVSAGTHLFVPVTPGTQGTCGLPLFPTFCSSGLLQLIQADQNGVSTPGYEPVAASATVGTTPVAEVNYSGSTAYAVFEVINANSSVTELAAIPVAVAFNSPQPATGTVTADASLGPLSSVMTDDVSAPLPRFTNVATALNAYAINSCAQPALSIGKTHVGNFTQGQQNAVYTVRISNPNATPTSGAITVTEDVPLGLGLASMSGSGWTCSMGTCSRSDALAAGASYPAITVLVNVTSNATSPAINTVSVSGAGLTTASATDPTTITAQAGPINFLTGYALDNPALRNDLASWLGMKVTIGASPLTVTSLGRICVAGNSGTHTVEFVNAGTGTLVPGGSAQVKMAGCTPGQFAYSALPTSIVLQANTAYFLASQEAAGGDQWYDAGAVSSTSDAAVSNPIYSSDNATWSASGATSNTSYVPPNFTYTPGQAAATGFLTGYALNSPAPRNNLSGWVGMQMTAGASPINVTSLGRICLAGNTGTHLVQIFSASNGIVVQNASVLVNLFGCTPGQFVYGALSSSAALEANTSYYVASQEFQGGDQWYDSGQVTSTNVGTVSNAIYSTDGMHWTAPPNTSNASYVSPNFTYQPMNVNVSVTAQAVNPNSGSGLSQTFALQYSDTAGAGNLQQVWVYFNATLANPATNTCLLYYNAPNHQISLLGDNGTTWQAATLGSAATLQNSQCSINAMTATVVSSGSTLTWNVPMTFQPAYAGFKNTYSRGIDISGATSGWQPLGNWTVASTVGTPTAISVTPNSGAGSSQTFALQYSDTAGAASLQQVWVYFNATLANPANNACLLYYTIATRQINLLGDNGTAWQAATLGTATTLQNSQCSINVAAATAVPSGDTLTWNVPMTFKPAYAGPKNVYLHAVDEAGTSNEWQQFGSWTVASTSATPAPVSVMPSGGTVAGDTFALKYSDTAGAASLQQVWVYFNATLANPASNACLLYYSAVSGQINLLNDNGTTWQAAALGAATTLQNSQCSVNAAASTVSSSGNTLTWNVPVTFKPAYAGAKNTYLRAIDRSGAASGWQALGVWTVPAGLGVGTPSAVSVTPSSGTGGSEGFVLQYSDTAGAGNLQQLWVYFNGTLVNPASNACMLYYSVATNQINLLSDDGTTWQAATQGSQALLQNSQCSIAADAFTELGSGNTSTWGVTLTFKNAFAGAKNIYSRAVDASGTTSGWQQLGSWTVPLTPSTPAAVSVTPNSGSGVSQTFALQYSDTTGAGRLEEVWVYFNATLANPAMNACLLYYSPVTDQINLLGDDGTTWQTATLGSANTLKNSQCSIKTATTTVFSSVFTLTWNAAITFEPAYAGVKNTYLMGVDASGPTSGWQQLGSWSVP